LEGVTIWIIINKYHEYKEKIRNLHGDVIEHIGTEIFDMESLEDLKQ